MRDVAGIELLGAAIACLQEGLPPVLELRAEQPYQTEGVGGQNFGGRLRRGGVDSNEEVFGSELHIGRLC